jgi:hypothetical protein
MEPKPNRALAIALAFVGAACLGGAAFTHSWLVNGNVYEHINFGLRSNAQCGSAFGEPECNTATNAELVEQMRGFSSSAADNTSGAFAPMGWATFVACLLGAFGLVAAAAIALAGKQPTLPMAPTTIALLAIMAGLITGCVFVATKPGPPGFVGVGLSFWIFGAGCVVGIAGAQMLAKVNRPPDPDLMEGAMKPDEF